MKAVITCYGCRDDEGNSPRKYRQTCQDCADDLWNRHRRMGHHCEMTVIRDDNPAKAFRMMEMASGLPFFRQGIPPT